MIITPLFKKYNTGTVKKLSIISFTVPDKVPGAVPGKSYLLFFCTSALHTPINHINHSIHTANNHNNHINHSNHSPNQSRITLIRVFLS